MTLKFYKCNHCGNIAVKVFDSGVPLVCCGEEMVELVPDSVDAAIEKHVPAITRDGNHIHVNIGEVDHPMIDEHYIQFICLEKEDGYDICPLEPGDSPRCDFYIGDDEIPVRVYEYCNIHGLWNKDM